MTVLFKVDGLCGTGGAPADELAVDVGAEDDIVGADVGWDTTGRMLVWVQWWYGGCEWAG